MGGMSNCSPLPGVFPTFGTAPLRPCSLQGDSWLSQVPELPPIDTCPGLRPRWCPAYLPCRTQDCCLPPTAHRRLSPSCFGREVILMATTIHISGLNTGPVPSLPLASDSPYRACPQVQLLACWLGFDQVGLSRYAITHWVTITHFIPLYRDSQGLGFTLARGLTG